MMKKIIANAKEFDSIDQIDFFDLGGSKGGSYKYMISKFTLGNFFKDTYRST